MSSKNISCFLRVRPAKYNEKDPTTGLCDDFITIQPDNKTVMLTNPDKSLTFYSFYWAFSGNNNNNSEIFQRAVVPVVDNALEFGITGSVVVTGATGTGKSFTMSNFDRRCEGIIPLSVRRIFQRVKNDDEETTVKLSFIQIYLDRLQDLFNPEAKEELAMRHEENGCVWTFPGITERQIKSEEEFREMYEDGNQYRVICAMASGREVARGHVVLILSIETKDLNTNQTRKSKIMFFELVGFENSTTPYHAASNVMMQEAQFINNSLISLSNVIQALSGKENEEEEKKKKIPWRSSKLTCIFQNALGSHTSKCAFIVCVGPSKDDLNETIGSLYFGSRVMMVGNNISTEMFCQKKSNEDDL